MISCCVVIFALFLQINQAFPSNPVLSFIENGRDAEVGEIPHQLALEKSVKGDCKNKDKGWGRICGAVLINKHQALTAAHCLQNVESCNATLRIVAGLHNLKQPNNTQTVIMKSYANHPDYNKSEFGASFANDIGIVTFASPLSMTDNVKAIAWNQNENVTFLGDLCVISGFGVNSKKEQENILQKVTSRAISEEECQNRMEKVKNVIIHSGHICTQGFSSAVCPGDSGGPLTCFHKGNQILAGLVSWFIGINNACNHTYPSVMTRISYVKQFILDNLDN